MWKGLIMLWWERDLNNFEPHIGQGFSASSSHISYEATAWHIINPYSAHSN